MNDHDPIFSSTVLAGSHQVPGFWHFMLPEDFQWLKFPTERASGCSACPSVALDGYFPNTKCCTYHPNISNFALGFGLADKKSAKFISSAIANGFATPEGSQISPALWALGIEDDNTSGFGKSDVIICPFLDQKNASCNIYPYRNSVCSSFFCRSNHGNKGHQHWDKVQEFVGQVEAALSQWALLEVGFNLDQYIKTLDDLALDILNVSARENLGWKKEIQQILFGTWHDRQEQLFIACAHKINAHRDRLYEIACTHKFQQPNKFEAAKFEMLPAKLAANLKRFGSCLGQPVPIEELWYGLQASHKHLWCFPIPDSKYILNSKVSFHENPLDSEISIFYSALPYIVTLQRKADQKSDEIDKNKIVRYISAQDFDILNAFATVSTVPSKLFDNYPFADGESIQTFISEWTNLDIILET